MANTILFSRFPIIRLCSSDSPKTALLDLVEETNCLYGYDGADFPTFVNRDGVHNCYINSQTRPQLNVLVKPSVIASFLESGDVVELRRSTIRKLGQMDDDYGLSLPDDDFFSKIIHRLERAIPVTVSPPTPRTVATSSPIKREVADRHEAVGNENHKLVRNLLWHKSIIRGKTEWVRIFKTNEYFQCECGCRKQRFHRRKALLLDCQCIVYCEHQRMNVKQNQQHDCNKVTQPPTLRC